MNNEQEKIGSEISQKWPVQPDYSDLQWAAREFLFRFQQKYTKTHHCSLHFCESASGMNFKGFWAKGLCTGFGWHIQIISHWHPFKFWQVGIIDQAVNLKTACKMFIPEWPNWKTSGQNSVEHIGLTEGNRTQWCSSDHNNWCMIDVSHPLLTLSSCFTLTWHAQKIFEVVFLCSFLLLQLKHTFCHCMTTFLAHITPSLFNLNQTFYGKAPNRPTFICAYPYKGHLTFLFITPKREWLGIFLVCRSWGY